MLLEIGSCVSKTKCGGLEKYRDCERNINVTGQATARKGLCLFEGGEKLLAMVSSSSYEITKMKHARNLTLKKLN